MTEKGRYDKMIREFITAYKVCKVNNKLVIDHLNDFLLACKICKVNNKIAVDYLLEYQHPINATEAIYDDFAKISEKTSKKMGRSTYGKRHMSIACRRL